VLCYKFCDNLYFTDLHLDVLTGNWFGEIKPVRIDFKCTLIMEEN